MTMNFTMPTRLKGEVLAAPKKERRDRNERRRENRGRRKERPQTIQSHSIFEQGPADSVRKTGVFSAVPSDLLMGLNCRSIACSSPLHPSESMCPAAGWHGATDLQDSAASPVCKLLKKERKESEEEDEDEILRKLQRDNVSVSCFFPVNFKG